MIGAVSASTPGTKANMAKAARRKRLKASVSGCGGGHHRKTAGGASSSPARREWCIVVAGLVPAIHGVPRIVSRPATRRTEHRRLSLWHDGVDGRDKQDKPGHDALRLAYFHDYAAGEARSELPHIGGGDRDAAGGGREDRPAQDGRRWRCPGPWRDGRNSGRGQTSDHRDDRRATCGPCSRRRADAPGDCSEGSTDPRTSPDRAALARSGTPAATGRERSGR